MDTTANTKTFSIASVVALVAAALSFTSGAILGLIFAMVAIGSGLLGIVLAVSPKTRGGVASTLAILAGAIGVIAAVFKAIGWFF